MSFKAHRLPGGTATRTFTWGVAPTTPPPIQAPLSAPEVERATAVPDIVKLTSIERDAFTKGYAQGERAGAEAAAARGQAMLRRLSQTIDELTALRADMIRRTERQMVQLSLAIAKRVVTREITMDRGLLAAMARVALERLGETVSATVRLHPDDHAAIAPGLAGAGQITLVADPLVPRGGCAVRSDFGFMDVSPEAQFEELARSLLDITGPPSTTAPAPPLEAAVAD